MLLLLFCASAARCAPVGSPAETKIIRGFATTKSGQKLAGATLYLINLPVSQGVQNPDAGNRVVTDAKGEFVWAVPAIWNDSVNLDTATTAPTCYAFAHNADWQIKFALARQNAQDSDTRTLAEEASRRCQTRWIVTPVGPRLSVLAPDIGQVQLKLRAPDGNPIRHKSVEIVANRRSDYVGAVVYRGQTDGNGDLVWRGFSELQRLRISVAGVGFGATGTFDLLADQTVRPAVPALAPFARVAGQVTPAVAAAGALVRASLAQGDQYEWRPRQTQLDDKGRFVLDDLLPGRNTLRIEKTNGAGAFATVASVAVTLAPGEKVSQVVLAPVSQAQNLENAGQFRGGTTRDPNAKSSVRGRLTDAAGAPLEGITVYRALHFPIRDSRGTRRRHQGHGRRWHLRV